MGASEVLLKAATDLVEVSRSLKSLGILLGDHMAARTRWTENEDSSLWGAVELIELNDAKVRNSIAALDRLRGVSDGEESDGVQERHLSEMACR